VTKTTFKTNDCPIAAGTEKWRIQALPPRYTGSELWGAATAEGTAITSSGQLPSS